MRKTLVAGLLFAAFMSGCLDGGNGPGRDAAMEPGLVPVQERHLQPYRVTDPPSADCPEPCVARYSHTLVPGPYEILEGVGFSIPVDLPPSEGVPAALGATNMHLGLFLPSIPGCDWAASSLNETCKVPVVADIGPYYSSTMGVADLQTEGDSIATEPANRLGGFLIENLVPYGYAVAQVSVYGTGDSGHCMDLMGTAEQLGIDAAVTWLGTQPWSNGKVGLTGRSYDGSTPWEAAMFGNPHLATIVPISGLTSQFDLMYHNGSSEVRGPGVLYGLYAAMTIDGDVSDGSQVLCPDYVTGGPEGVKATLTGDPTAADPYWSERIFLDRALENYEGSVYMIHGLQDWNVEPHMAFPAYNLFEDKGNEVKALLGQWGHMYPDRPSEHAGLDPGRGAEAFPHSVRYDWAQDLLEWFDYTLKGSALKPQMHVEVQDNQGFWRVEETWPPAHRNITHMSLQGTASVNPVISPDCAAEPCAILPLERPVEGDLRIAGLPHLDLAVTPAGPGGQIYALLETRDGLHLGHAILDLRFASGERAPQPVVPGLPMNIRLEFEPMDVLVPEGEELQLVLQATGEDYVSPTVVAPIIVNLETSELELPIVYPDAAQFFTPPVWAGVAEAGPPEP
jgi:hypothetical protein